MPLPSVLRPDATESPLPPILVDPLDGLKQAQRLAAPGDLFVADVHVSVGLPYVVAEGAVGVWGARSEALRIWPVADLVEEYCQDALRLILQNIQSLEVIVALWGRVDADKVTREARSCWFIIAPNSVLYVPFDTITRQIQRSFYHSAVLKIVLILF